MSLLCFVSFFYSFYFSNYVLVYQTNSSLSEWQWEQLRLMKVGSNESATKFFRANGGTAALNSSSPKTKYESSAAVKYKEELKRRAARDAEEYVSYSYLI